MEFTVTFDLPESTTRGESTDGSAQVHVNQQDLDLAEGNTERERAVDAAKTILYEAPAFDNLSDYAVQKASVESVERRAD